MSDVPKRPQPRQRLTVVEMGSPLDPSPEELATRVVGIAFRERFTVVEMGSPLDPSPEELATRVVEPLINDGPVDAKSSGLLSQSAKSLKPNRPATRTASLELRARAEAARRKMIEEIATPVAPSSLSDPLPPSVRLVFDELLASLQPLHGAERAAAVEYVLRELNKHRAG